MGLIAVHVHRQNVLPVITTPHIPYLLVPVLLVLQDSIRVEPGAEIV